jgi:hypothetical protein
MTIKAQTNANNPQTFTDRLQTIANAGQSPGGLSPSTRRGQMVWLATLTAITLVGQYVMLANFGFGNVATELPWWFLIGEKSLWGLRALVEVAVVVYVATTTPNDKREARALVWLEVLLIGLILVTVGPAWISAALEQSILSTLSVYGVYAWGLSLAGISATMLAAVGYAYRVQPVDAGGVVVTIAEYERMLAAVGEAEAAAGDALAAVGAADGQRQRALAERDRALAELDGMREAVEVLRLLPPSAQVQIVGVLTNNAHDPNALAQEFGLSPSTVRGALAKVNGNGRG